MSHRKIALKGYKPICAYCGFGVIEVLEAAHIDGNRRNGKLDNLVLLCPTCHRMLDLDLISNKTIKTVRDRAKTADWKKLQKYEPAKAKDRALRAWVTIRRGKNVTPSTKK